MVVFSEEDRLPFSPSGAAMVSSSSVSLFWCYAGHLFWEWLQLLAYSYISPPFVECPLNISWSIWTVFPPGGWGGGGGSWMHLLPPATTKRAYIGGGRENGCFNLITDSVEMTSLGWRPTPGWGFSCVSRYVRDRPLQLLLAGLLCTFMC